MLMEMEEARRQTDRSSTLTNRTRSQQLEKLHLTIRSTPDGRPVRLEAAAASFDPRAKAVEKHQAIRQRPRAEALATAGKTLRWSRVRRRTPRSMRRPPTGKGSPLKTDHLSASFG